LGIRYYNYENPWSIPYDPRAAAELYLMNIKPIEDLMLSGFDQDVIRLYLGQIYRDDNLILFLSELLAPYLQRELDQSLFSQVDNVSLIEQRDTEIAQWNQQQEKGQIISKWLIIKRVSRNTTLVKIQK